MVHSLQVSAPHCSLAPASGSSWRAFSGHHHIPSIMKGALSLYRPSAAGLFYKHFLFIYSFINWVILLRERSPPTTCHLSCVMCQVSRAKCNMSGVMSKVSHNMSHFFVFTKCWSWLVEGLLSMGPTLSSFSFYCFYSKVLFGLYGVLLVGKNSCRQDKTQRKKQRYA